MESAGNQDRLRALGLDTDLLREMRDIHGRATRRVEPRHPEESIRMWANQAREAAAEARVSSPDLPGIDGSSFTITSGSPGNLSMGSSGQGLFWGGNDPNQGIFQDPNISPLTGRPYGQTAPPPQPGRGLWEQLTDHYQGYQPRPAQQAQPMNEGLDAMSQAQVMSALQLLATYLPNAFASSNMPRVDIQGALQPLRDEIQQLRQELAGVRRDYEEVLYRLETEGLATSQEVTA